jgi:hypothetical protein
LLGKISKLALMIWWRFREVAAVSSGRIHSLPSSLSKRSHSSRRRRELTLMLYIRAPQHHWLLCWVEVSQDQGNK